jgi:hypothetical protein
LVSEGGTPGKLESDAGGAAGVSVVDVDVPTDVEVEVEAVPPEIAKSGLALPESPNKTMR